MVSIRRVGCSLVSAVLVGLLAGCTGGSPSAQDSPSSSGSAPTTETPTPSARAEPTPCWSELTRPTRSESKVVVVWEITSGVPSPMWRLGRAEATHLLDVLAESGTRRSVNGPRRLGDYGILASGRDAQRLIDLGLPSEFWVGGDSDVGVFLASTGDCGS